jgi:flagellar protein FlbD
VILVTRFNGTQFYVNAELIQTVESTPDTVISFVDGIKIVVHETAEEVVQRVIAYKRQVYSDRPVRATKNKGIGE